MVNPAIFNLGPLQVRWYGVLLALAFVIGYFILIKLAKERKIKRDDIDDFFVWFIIGTLAGARLFEVLFYGLPYYLQYPWKIFFVWEGGLASHGGILGGIFVIWLFSKKIKIKFYDLADIVVIPFVLGAVFVRIGNFINGEIVGRVTGLPWAVKFEGYEGLRHPSQIYEAIKNFILFFILWNMRNIKKLPRGIIFWSSIGIFSFFRFFIEFFKEYQVFSYGLTMGQWLSVVFFIIPLIMVYRIWKSP